MIKSIEDGRKEDGNRSIADKIIQRLHDLVKTVENNHGRWAWELLQNAKDSVADAGRKVSVQINFSADKIEFLHNGNHFTEKDIRGLINQISSKEVEEGETSKRTGRFGTGFLTTHLLSKVVFIKGIVETVDNRFFQFGFPLDRNGKTTAALIPKIENAWAQFHASTENSEVEGYDEDEFNTSFTYMLETDEQKEIAQIGIREFTALIPYVLCFIPQIHAVEIINNLEGKVTTFENREGLIDGFKRITKIENGASDDIRLLYATNGTVSIAAQAVQVEDYFELVKLDEIPKLFCDFPLIGTEDFHFPVVVNSFYFNPQTERDGIWLKGENDPEVLENRELLQQALTLYQGLIDGLEIESFTSLFNIANTSLPVVDERYFDADWYATAIQKPLREFLITKPIVELEDGTYRELDKIWFPLKSYTKEIKEKLWQYTYDLFPYAVCRKDDLHDWLEVVWDTTDRITFKMLAQDIADVESIGKLSESLGVDEDAAFKWLNEVGTYIMSDETNNGLFDKYAIIPNENGNFLLKNLLFIDEIKDAQLIEVLQLLGDDWNDILLNEKVEFGEYHTKNKSEIANKINERLRNNTNKDQNLNNAISLLSEWFDNNNPDDGSALFGDTYRKRAELFMNTIEDKDSLYKVMRCKTDLAHLSKVAEAIDENPRIFDNIEQTKAIYSLLKKHKVNDLDVLRKLLNERHANGQNSILPVTHQILANMGISSLDEWKEAIKDKDLAALYSHKSTPTTDMFVYVQSLIQKAKAKIKAHLQTLDSYNLDNLDETTAPTILAGILKDGRQISIVARPAYDGEVIIYYGSERDILDYEPSELWIDDGKKPRQISLGHLLKTAKIVKFPV